MKKNKILISFNDKVCLSFGVLKRLQLKDDKERQSYTTISTDFRSWYPNDDWKLIETSEIDGPRCSNIFELIYWWWFSFTFFNIKTQRNIGASPIFTCWDVEDDSFNSQNQCRLKTNLHQRRLLRKKIPGTLRTRDIAHRNIRFER